GILFGNSLANEPFRKLEPLLQVFLPAIGKACAKIDRDGVVFFVYDIEGALYGVDLFEDKLDNVFSKRIKGVVKPQDFTDLCYTPNDPVAFFVTTLVLDEVLSHVDERHAENVVVGNRLKLSIVFTFPDTLREFGVVFQGLYQVVNLGGHLTKLIGRVALFPFRKDTISNEREFTLHAAQRLHH